MNFPDTAKKMIIERMFNERTKNARRNTAMGMYRKFNADVGFGAGTLPQSGHPGTAKTKTA
jgi:hypothetical protein